MRWQHPQRGMVYPAEFIGQAEKAGLIVEFGQWALTTACEQLAAWAHDPQTAHLSISVNVSARQFRQPDFAQCVLEILERTGADAHQLKLELTESMLLTDLDALIARMAMLKETGLGFSLDDFGTGYSSLSYLKKPPLDQLKIDRSFVQDMLQTPHAGPSCRPSSAWRVGWAWMWWPKAWRPASNGPPCGSSAAPACRATCSASRRRWSNCVGAA
jgi:EAL domain-containing protein (putative c-di-GMP-specific phosphodiesterase class I)